MPVCTLIAKIEGASLLCWPHQQCHPGPASQELSNTPLGEIFVRWVHKPYSPVVYCIKDDVVAQPQAQANVQYDWTVIHEDLWKAPALVPCKAIRSGL